MTLCFKSPASLIVMMMTLLVMTDDELGEDQRIMR